MFLGLKAGLSHPRYNISIFDTKTNDSNIIQVSDYCSPNASSCYDAVSKDDYGCRVSCTGLYADIYHTDDAEKDRFSSMFAMLAEEGKL